MTITDHVGVEALLRIRHRITGGRTMALDRKPATWTCPDCGSRMHVRKRMGNGVLTCDTCDSP